MIIHYDTTLLTVIVDEDARAFLEARGEEVPREVVDEISHQPSFHWSPLYCCEWVNVYLPRRGEAAIYEKEGKMGLYWAPEGGAHRPMRFCPACGKPFLLEEKERVKRTLHLKVEVPEPFISKEERYVKEHAQEKKP